MSPLPGQNRMPIDREQVHLFAVSSLPRDQLTRFIWKIAVARSSLQRDSFRNTFRLSLASLIPEHMVGRVISANMLHREEMSAEKYANGTQGMHLAVLNPGGQNLRQQSRYVRPDLMLSLL